MDWATLIGLGLSAATSLYAGSKSADAGKDASAAAARQAEIDRLIGLTLAEPNRSIGYQALGDLASIYGYSMPAYTPLNRLGATPASSGSTGTGVMPSDWALGTTVGIGGRARDPALVGFDNPFSSSGRKYGGTIDPTTGTVTINHNQTKKQQRLSDLATRYLRGDPSVNLDKKEWSRVRDAINDMREQGWTYQATQAPVPEQQAPAAPSMARFFASPDYEFRRAEGQRGIQQTAAARGGLFSGNTLKALSDYNSNLASGEFGNYWNRLAEMAGFGQVGNVAAQNAINTTGRTLTDSIYNSAAARSSGYQNVADTMNGTIANLLLYKYLGKGG